jgi:hypothetical protein
MRLKGVNIVIGVEVPKLRWSCNRTVILVVMQEPLEEAVGRKAYLGINKIERNWKRIKTCLGNLPTVHTCSFCNFKII